MSKSNLAHVIATVLLILVVLYWIFCTVCTLPFVTFHHIWTLVAGYVLIILVNNSLWLVDDWYLWNVTLKSWTYNKSWYGTVSVFSYVFKKFSMYLCRNGTWWKLRIPYFYSRIPSCSQTITGLHQFGTMKHRNLKSVTKRVKCSWIYASDLTWLTW